MDTTDTILTEQKCLSSFNSMNYIKTYTKIAVWQIHWCGFLLYLLKYEHKL